MASCRTLERRRIALINKREKKLDKNPKYLKTKEFRRDRLKNYKIIKQLQKKGC